MTRSHGGKDLKNTEHYAMAFGCRHANLYDPKCNSYDEAGEPGYDIISDASTDSEIGDEEWCFEDFKNNHEGTLAALQQKLKQTETEKQNFRAQLNVVERKLADATDR